MKVLHVVSDWFSQLLDFVFGIAGFVALGEDEVEEVIRIRSELGQKPVQLSGNLLLVFFGHKWYGWFLALLRLNQLALVIKLGHISLILVAAVLKYLRSASNPFDSAFFNHRSDLGNVVSWKSRCVTHSSVNCRPIVLSKSILNLGHLQNSKYISRVSIVKVSMHNYVFALHAFDIWASSATH